MKRTLSVLAALSLCLAVAGSWLAQPATAAMVEHTVAQLTASSSDIVSGEVGEVGLGVEYAAQSDGYGYRVRVPTMAAPQDSAIILDTVYNIKPDGKIPAGPDLKFMMRWIYSTGGNVKGFCNGFRVYSPDGATWQPIVLNAMSLDWGNWFPLCGGLCIHYSSVNGSGADTVLAGGAGITGTGIAPPFDTLVWWIETQVYPADTGKHLCVDSSYFPQNMPWVWCSTGGSFVPNWSGPHCFEIAACCNHDGIRGDVDYSLGINIADAVFLVDYIFFGGPPPPCLEEGDADGDGSINVADVVYLVQYIFLGGPAPPPCP